MPIYSTNKTYRGGFYNNKVINGEDDRVYNAKDMRKPYDTVFSDGIFPDPDGTAGDSLKVTAGGDMQITVAAGKAKIGGAWFENTANFNIILDTAGSATRYDCVIIRNDDSEAVRAPSIYIKSLTAPPTASDLIREGDIYEICVAYVKVVALTTNISQSNISDTRMDGSLCNVMSGVGATVVRTYNNTYFSETANQTVIPIGIPQYNKGNDTLIVAVEGRVFTEGANYTITDNTKIALSIGLPVIGTKIQFQVLKNVTAAGAESVVQEVAGLRTEMTAANKILEHHYYCNGINDNINISAIAQSFINGGTDYRSMKLIVHGHIGVTAAYSGSGTDARNYFWFALGKDGESTNRRLIVDFSDCEAITLPIAAGTYNTVFSGNDVHIIGANVIASQNGTGTYIRMFSSSGGAIYAENCRFWITADVTSYISQTGTFVRCRGSVTTSSGAAYCFYATEKALLRVRDGEYYAYSPTAYTPAVIYNTADDAVIILYGVNCPTVARSGFIQNKAINASSVNVSVTDLITTLPLSVPNGDVFSVLNVNKPNMM